MTTTIECPECNSEIHLEVVATVPDEQAITLTFESDTGFISADVLGGMLTNASATLSAVADSIGTPVVVQVSRCEVDAGIATVEFRVVAIHDDHIDGVEVTR